MVQASHSTSCFNQSTNVRLIQNYSFLHSSAISVTLRSLWLNHWLIWRVASSFRLTWLISRFSHKASSEKCWCMHRGIQDATSTTQFSGISGNKWTAFWELLKLSRALPDRRWLRLTSDITCNIKKQYHSEQYIIMIQGYLLTDTMQWRQSSASLEIVRNMWNTLPLPRIPDSLLFPPKQSTADTWSL